MEKTRRRELEKRKLLRAETALNSSPCKIANKRQNIPIHFVYSINNK